MPRLRKACFHGIFRRDPDEKENEIYYVDKWIVDCQNSLESIVAREEVQEKWDKTKNKWAALIDHQEIDNIEETMHRVEMLIGDPEEKVELLSELNKLGFYLEHIPEREAFSLENVL